MVFQKYVMYVSADCVGSAKAIDAAQNFREEVRLVDVADLARPLPTWLRGTPTVVQNTPEGMLAYAGTGAIEFLRSLSAASTDQSELQALPDLDADDTEWNEPIDDRPSQDKVTESDLEALMKQRESQLPPSELFGQ